MATRTKCWLIVVAVFVIGVIGGILIGIYRPNDITFVIRANGEVNLVPHARDVVHWIAEDPNGKYTAKPPTVSFYSKSPKGTPCTATPDPTTTTYPISDCKVTSVPLDYYYDCVNPVTHRPCKDPQWGPGSGPQPHSAKYKQTLKYTLSDVFHIFSQPEPSELAAAPAAPATIPPPDASIQCDADGKPEVTPITYTSNSTDAMEWSSSGITYTFDLSQAVLSSSPPSPPLPGPLSCAEKVTSFSDKKPNAICTLENYGAPGTIWTYSVTNISGCSQSNTATGTITIGQP